ncbi:formimidoylglutamate deiminase [Nocardioides sp. Arc9.136]|uniref:formimidoylglutamate deiminase n=1 Tax=Nocardioides sp. Arc9.136 TaxID=2996826 RepID=UPI002665C663|nr:formimidoylglutamate deiminase [Nocardioides sp. Arc9.136]WKN48234.1 formimidoylglutamate deiminase [Nocardioides sp. Arc9.136]
MTAYLLERAWVDGTVRDDVLVEVVDGRFATVAPDAPGADAERVPGLALPGLANCHSHAFHRALRGRTQRGSGTFWTWREQMYDVAARLTPETYHRLARAVFREMLAGGVTTVGEFHYLHHRPDGTPYDDPNAMGHALAAAAEETGIRLVLLDTCYLSSGFGAPVTGAQVRCSDGSAAAWAQRVAALSGVRVGAAVHSVRAVPRTELAAFRGLAPLHVHLSEQPAENDDCRAAYGVTPTRLLHDEGLLGPGTTVVHATHLTDEDVALLGDTGTTACFCPTTERDLGDGIGPGRRLHEAGARLSLGSDSHAVVDLFEEMRALELDERLASRTRGHWPAADLLAAATRHDSLGVDDAGALSVGHRADLVVLDTGTVRTAGTGADEHTAVFAAGAEDVVATMVDGRWVARREDRPAIGRELAAAVEEVLA